MKKFCSEVFSSLASSLSPPPVIFNGVAIAHRASYKKLEDGGNANANEKKEDEDMSEDDPNQHNGGAKPAILYDSAHLDAVGEPIVLTTLYTAKYKDLPMLKKTLQNGSIVEYRAPI